MSELIHAPHRVFLSHDSHDAELAGILAKTLERITLGQLAVWFSSDQSPAGGLRPGQIWHNEIIRRLKESRVMLALLTKRSVDRPWIIFESGFAAALTNCTLVPVCIGLNVTHDLPSPLAAYQAVALTDYDSLHRFASKLLHEYGIAFDSEMTEPILKRTISDLVLHSPTDNGTRLDSDPLGELGSRIMQHIDLRLVEMEQRYRVDRGPGAEIEEPEDELLSYSVPIQLRFAELNRIEHVIIRPSTSVQDVLDAIFYMLYTSIKMPPFQYLTRWILAEEGSGIKLVLREVGSMIPATTLFSPSARWTAVPLSEPYSPLSSDDEGRWYHKRV